MVLENICEIKCFLQFNSQIWDFKIHIGMWRMQELWLIYLYIHKQCSVNK